MCIEDVIAYICYTSSIIKLCIDGIICTYCSIFTSFNKWYSWIFNYSSSYSDTCYSSFISWLKSHPLSFIQIISCISKSHTHRLGFIAPCLDHDPCALSKFSIIVYREWTISYRLPQGECREVISLEFDKSSASIITSHCKTSHMVPSYSIIWITHNNPFS